MNSTIVVHPSFDGVWPYAADHFRELWEKDGAVEFIRLALHEQRPLSEIVARPAQIERLVSFNGNVTEACAGRLSALKEAVLQGRDTEAAAQAMKSRGVKIYRHPSEGFWGQSVSEFGLALTLCGLRRIPQTHHAILSSHDDWNYNPGSARYWENRGHQFGDDPRFINGTLEGKRVRIVGAGNIASRYASFCSFMGADVAAWDPFATEPCFHRANARREHHLDRLIEDAEIFVPMVPLTDTTQGIVTAAHINALPKGCLVVLVTRARICDCDALRKRVLNDELALAADVFDIEPLPLNDPLLGRHNVVHTPHNAGRTRQANESFAQKLAEQFLPVRN